VTSKTKPNRNRLAEVKFDEKSIPRGFSDRDHECAAAVFDLIEDNRFGVRDRNDGPYSLRIAQVESRLTFEVRTVAGAPVVVFAVSMTPFRPLLKDYFNICENYYSAIRSAGPRQIEEIDRARTATHNEGAGLLAARLADKVEIDEATARRLFTLVSALHWHP
jgi:uncharacterized protein (UPF0262 family)